MKVPAHRLSSRRREGPTSHFHSPLSLTSRSPTRSCIGRTLVTAGSLFAGRCPATRVRQFVYLASDRRTPRTRQPDVIILNSAVEIAAVLVLLQEATKALRRVDI
jgi:hypothetical protein